ncbi:NAD(P)/FAD-dependent oxidoreductase [Nitrospira sp. NS4]|uniref:NAD(P)/FAD-dependent oxidoreductase n=1 Tax=Nitrospira sp. NS4 TaxID=3414498 RepID=UPI003C2E3EFE
MAHHSSPGPLPTPLSCDVLVVGAGPAGSTISALLAERGWNVHVLEKDPHPRFHIGESLLPQSLPILKQLGVLPEVEKIGIVKYGAEMISHRYGRTQMFYFSKAFDESQPYAFEVKRSEFDAILLKNAIAKGAQVHEGVRAGRVEFRPGTTSLVHAQDRGGKPLAWEARFVVDASGRDTFLSGQLGGKQRSQTHNSAAVFGHFEGVGRLPGKDEGNITAAWLDHGWCWMIPFKDGTTSVGVVCWPDYIKSRTTPLDQFLLDTLRQSPVVAERMRHAKLLTPVYAAANFSYRRDTMAGDGYLIVGDAFAFIDPVFSSGVHLALNSAVQGANVVEAHLRHSADYAQRLREFERMVRRGIKTFSWFIHRFTQPAFQSLFVSTRKPPKIERAVLSLLAGDVYAQKRARFPLFLFKVCYYTVFVLNWKENWAVCRRRKSGTSTTVTEVQDYAVKQPF